MATKRRDAPVESKKADTKELGIKLIDALETPDCSKARRLILKGADVNARNEYGMTALMWASATGDKEIVGMLIDRGARVNATSKGKGPQTAISMAKLYQKPEMVRILKAALHRQRLAERKILLRREEKRLLRTYIELV
jgi:ankyrin repeat protein